MAPSFNDKTLLFVKRCKEKNKRNLFFFNAILVKLKESFLIKNTEENREICFLL